MPRQVRGIFLPAENLQNTENQLWELACLRKRWASRLMYGLTHRLREQARSHIRPHSNAGTRSSVVDRTPMLEPDQVWSTALLCWNSVKCGRPHSNAGTRSSVGAGLLAKQAPRSY